MSAPPDPGRVRQVTCARCGDAFQCGPAGDCWCAAEPFRLELPPAESKEDCLCPPCLRAKAAGASRTGSGDVTR